LPNDDSTTIQELRELVDQFVTERDWHQFHHPKNLAMSIAIEAAELMEVFQWVTSEKSREMVLSEDNKIKMTEELADVFIYCLNFANATGLDITSAVIAKVGKNARKYPVGRYRGHYQQKEE
jgi:NTP pyrophosphatase (non-canonical NTP hydrolase)